MNDDKYNYIDMKKGQFVFNNYKTQGKYNTVVVPIEKKPYDGDRTIFK